jgi:hypothetical protein
MFSSRVVTRLEHHRDVLVPGTEMTGVGFGIAETGGNHEDLCYRCDGSNADYLSLVGLRFANGPNVPHCCKP